MRPWSIFSYVSIEERIPTWHPLRQIRKLESQALNRLDTTLCALQAEESRTTVLLELPWSCWVSTSSLNNPSTLANMRQPPHVENGGNDLESFDQIQNVHALQSLC